jgi:hypothetical protein
VIEERIPLIDREMKGGYNLVELITCKVASVIGYDE